MNMIKIKVKKQKYFSTIASCFCVLASLSVVSWVSAAEIPAAVPEEVGMSSERLDRINTVMQRHIDAGDIQGAVTAVARRGKLVHFETHGLMDVDNNRPMESDAIHIMMSSTKPFLNNGLVNES